MIKYFILILLTISACSGKKTYENFDASAWQNDKLGCNGERQRLVPDLNLIRDELKGLSQKEIIDLLGKPDSQLLYARNQKFYIYFIEKGIQCEGKVDASKARVVSFRFGALDSVTEITYSDGKPI